jgi:hypothetical protein
MRKLDLFQLHLWFVGCVNWQWTMGLAGRIFNWWMGVMKNMIWIVIGAGVVVAAITVLGLPAQAGGLL